MDLTNKPQSTGIEESNLPANIQMVIDVPLLVTVELGRTRLTLHQVLDLQPGSVVELDNQAGEPVDIYVNERLVARGEVVVVDDKFGVRLTKLLTASRQG